MKVMTINGKDIATWKAKLLDFAPSTYAVTNDTTAASGTLYPALLHTSVSPLTLSITLDVYGRDMADAEMTASHLLSELSRQVEIGGPDGFLYRSILQSASRTRTVNWIVTLTVTFLAVRHKPKVTVPMESEKPLTILCESNVETECTFRISAPSGGMVLIQGTCLPSNIRVFNMNAGDEIVIDGIEKTVLDADKINRFGNIGMSGFPHILPGENIFRLITLGLDEEPSVILEYYPTFM